MGRGGVGENDDRSVVEVGTTEGAEGHGTGASLELVNSWYEGIRKQFRDGQPFRVGGR